MKHYGVLLLSLCVVSPVVAQEKGQQRLTDSYNVLKDALDMPDKGTQ